MEQRLQNKIAIVTGAGQGIGQGVALRLAREGAAVVVAEYNPETGASTAAEIQALGRPARAYPLDVADVAAVQRMVADVVKQFGRIDILVNNAGVMQTKPMLELTEADWDRVVNVNQRGLFFCLQAVAAQMVRQLPPEVLAAGRAERSYGKIINFSSVAGRSGRPLATHYSASKTAVISITKSAALALAPYGINVNAICPGLVPTPMWAEIDRTHAQAKGLEPGEWIRQTVEVIPLKRPASPADIAAAVAFLAGPDSDYITGQALNVDGGLEMD